MSAEWSTLDSLSHSSLAERYISGVIETTMQLTFMVTFDPELDFLKQNRFMSAVWSTLASLPPFSLAQRYESVVI
jgi:FPC/CPF motif-containing protein YcgG